MKVNFQKWMSVAAFWLLVCLLTNCQNDKPRENKQDSPKVGADSSPVQNRPKKEKVVRELTRQAAIRIFSKLANEPNKAHTIPAQKVADSLRKGFLEGSIDNFIKPIDVNKNLKGSTENLKNLERKLMAIDSAKLSIQEYEGKVIDLAISWQNSLTLSYYNKENIRLDSIMSGIDPMFEFFPPNGNLATDYYTNLYNQEKQKRLKLEKKIEELNAQINSLNKKIEELEGRQPKPKFELLWLLVGAIIGGGIALWFAFRQKHELSEDWKKVSKEIKERKILSDSSYPNNADLKVGQVLTAIEILHEQAGKVNQKKPNPEQTISQDRIIIQSLRDELGNVDLVEAVRGFKEEARVWATEKQGLEQENQRLETQLVQMQKAPTEPKILPQQGQQSQPKTFAYFSQPKPEGWFDNNEQYDQPNSSTCYRFTFLTKGAGTATFNVEASPDRMPRILNYRDRFLDPACESQNNYQTSHSQVVTLREGKAKLNNNGQWRVETKAQIRFE